MADRYIYKEEEHQGRLVLGDPQAEAYAWIMAYADQITEQAKHHGDEDWYSSRDVNYTAEDLISIAESHKKGGWGDYICHGGAFEGTDVDPLFRSLSATSSSRTMLSLSQNRGSTLSPSKAPPWQM